jgi:hypothetical protein
MDFSEARKVRRVNVTLDSWELRHSRDVIAPELGRFARRRFEQAADIMPEDGTVTVEVKPQVIQTLQDKLGERIDYHHDTLRTAHPHVVGYIVAEAELPGLERMWAELDNAPVTP